MNFYIETFGCQMNVNESEKMAGLLIQAGYTCVSQMEDADVILANTCAVRQKSEEKVYGFIGRTISVRKLKPSLKVGVCGCVAEKEGRTLLKRKGVDFVFGTRAFPHVVSLIERGLKGERFVETGDFLFECTSELPTRRLSFHHGWVTIIHGCDKFCSYCIVPYTRGRERSRPFTDIFSEVNNLVEQGYREITFLGQNVDSYGKDLADQNLQLSDVLRNAAKIDGIDRIWFLTSYPTDFSDSVTDIIAQYPNMARSLLLPIQSGSNAVLKNMNRRYTREDYLALIDRIRMKIPDVSLSTDLIVGFPGETESDFEQSVQIVEKVQFERLNLAMYSPRTGTVAEKMFIDDVPYPEKNRRLQVLLTLQKSINKTLNELYLQKKVWVIGENATHPGSNLLYGRTDNNRIVIFEGGTDLIGKWIEVLIGKVTAGPLYGRISQVKAL